MDYYKRIAEALEIISQNPITAYEMAVTGGYTGTLEEFEADMGNSGTNASNAAASASAAAASAESVSASAAQIATNTSDISDLKESFINEQKRTAQLFNKFDYITGKLYVRTSDSGLRNQNYCVSLTFPVNVQIGDRFALYASGDYSSFISNYSLTRIAFSDDEPAANGTVKEYSAESAKDAAHISCAMIATATANYMLVSFVFASTVTEENALAGFEEFAKTLTICKLGTGYPEDYIPYYIVDVNEDNLSDELREKINKTDKTAEGYGIKWNIANPNDLGSRCFNAIGMNAAIGVGATNGNSDFDAVYPWSEIKRCNIKENENGAFVVTYEGESGFAVDGSNGDVFVRIPKYNILRYKENGYEYRVIGVPGSTAHEAFVEDGKELDEIFVGAFEGYVNNNALKSISGVIPTSNITAGEFLSAAKANGDNYTLYDLRTVDAIWNLIAIEYGCRNTNRILGYGLADFLQPSTSNGKVSAAATQTNTVQAHITSSNIAKLPVGSNITICDSDQTNIIAQRKITNVVSAGTNEWNITFDGSPVDVTTDCFVGSAAFNTGWASDSPTGGLSWHTGRNDWITDSVTQNAVRYRWIENPVGNLWHLLPDVTFNNLQMYMCKNMKDYSVFSVTGAYLPYGDTLIENNDNGSKNDVANANYWITELLDDTFAKSALFGKAYNKALTSDKAFGAYYYLQTGTKIIANGGGFDHLWRSNMLTNRAWIPATGSGSKWYLYGARLIFKKIA